MKIMVIPPRRSGCYGPTAATLTVDWTSLAAQSEGCFVTVFTQVTAENPCPTSYALSTYLEVWYYTVDISDGTLVWTTVSSPETFTIGPGTTIFYPEVGGAGPIPVDVSDGQIARVLVYVTWPDSTVTSYSFDNFTASCG